MDEFNIYTIVRAIIWLVYVLGIPGNILSAIIWLRRRKNVSAVYLAALATNDLVILVISCLFDSVKRRPHEIYWLPLWYLEDSACILKPLLILGFSVERLFAILRPLKVSFNVLKLMY